MADQATRVLSRAVVVTDDPEIRQEAEFVFPADMEVHLAWDAGDAIDLIRRVLPAVVIVDLRSGNAGGFSLTREMRQFSELDDVPVLIVLEREQDGWLADQAGATAYRTKPIDTSDLVADALALMPPTG